MLETSARLLALLSLLQTRREWSGPELAERLDITTRTVRRDIDKLRELGYPVDANVGSRGGYRLGAGADAFLWWTASVCCSTTRRSSRSP